MTEVSFPDVVLYAIPGFVAFVFLEIVLWKAGRKNPFGKTVRFNTKDAAASLAMGGGNVVVGLIFGGAIAATYGFLYQFRMFEMPITWWMIAIVFVVDDFLYYVFHRLAHEHRWFWASHIVHHSSQHYNLTTALRQTWTGFFAGSFLFSAPMLLVGVHPAVIGFVGGINLVYQFWIHTEAIDRFPRWVEAVMNTPAHHRVHHATNPDYLDSNYAGVFIVWDRMFGTFVDERKDEPPRYGIVRNLGTFNPLKIAVHEWLGIFNDVRKAKSLRDVWGYTFGPPGWSPDGSRRTSAMIKQAWAEEQAKQDQTTSPAAAE
ncbi:MAG: sterol desaturase family protein [Alphaproteobacteria bacterium]